MRYRVRIQPYVAPEVQRKLRSYAKTRGLTESAVTEAALVEYLDRDQVEQPLVVRRLDTIGGAVDHIKRDLDVTAQALSFLARFAFLFAPDLTSDQALRAEAKERCDTRYAQLVARVAGDLQAGVTLTGDVRRAVPMPPAAVNPTGGR